MEIIRETGLDRMGEDAEHIEEDADTDDRGDAATPPPVPVPPTATAEEIIEEGPKEMVPGQEAPVAPKVILADAKPEMP
jgi:hypothetical protein